MQRVRPDRDVTHGHGAGGRLLQEVQAPQEGGLAAPGSPDHHHRLVLPDRQPDAAEDVVATEPLLDADRLKDDVAEARHQRSLLAMRRSRRSWKREKAIVRIQYTRAAKVNVSSVRK